VPKGWNKESAQRERGTQTERQSESGDNESRQRGESERKRLGRVDKVKHDPQYRYVYIKSH
jgi:hypothetical protein